MKDKKGWVKTYAWQKRSVTTMRKRVLLLGLLIALTIGGLLAVSHSQTESIQAGGNALTAYNDVSAISQSTILGIQGSYQSEDPSNQGYNLWQYRYDNIGGNPDYYQQNYCEYQTTNPHVHTGNRHTTQIDNDEIIDLPDDHTHTYGTRPNRYTVEHKLPCDDMNAAYRGDNLTHNWNPYTGIYKNAVELEKMEPFLVIGTTRDNGGGIQSPELEMNIWLPNKEERSSERLIIETGELCNLGSNWDLNSNLGEDTLSITLEGLNNTEIFECPTDDRLTWSVRINDIVGILGAPRDRQSFTRVNAGTPETISYELYKLTVRTDKDRAGRSYTNQFRLKITSPASSYFGIIKTEFKSENEPENALGLGMRLPGDYFTQSSPYQTGDPLTFRRLQILWEVNLYGAVDPSESCSEGGIVGKFGLYDHDYPTQAWLNPDYPPSLQIFHTDRTSFLEGTKANWNNDLNDNRMIDIGKELFYFNDTTKSQNLWDVAEYDEFEADKIYRFRFFNLDQRSWMQIGIPFSQSNALQPCTKKPLVKVYHGDISAGGWFGQGRTSRVCREEDADNLLNGDKGHIYAHASLRSEGDEGSSAEYAVYARNPINAFYSGYKPPPWPPPKTAPPHPPSRLTFANSDNPWGGNFSNELRCISNWWRRAEQLESTIDNSSIEFWMNQLNGIPLSGDQEQLFKPPKQQPTLPRGRLTIRVNDATSPPNPAPNLDLKAAIYVDGDLLIEENIINENTGLNKLNQIKSIYFIVRGDILIHHGVTRIDAILIAIPTNDDQTKDGRIFTCYVDTVTNGSQNLVFDPVNEKGKIPPGKLDILKNQLHDISCRQKLTINGALIARQIRLGRVTNPNPPPTNSYNPNEGPVTEQINLLPEYFVGTPQLPTHTDWYYASDSVTILPVNF